MSTTRSSPPTAASSARSPSATTAASRSSSTWTPTELVKLTSQGFAFFEEAFDYPYPFHKYDQLYVPEYNMGAMENAGAVTLRDEYLPRSRQDAAFYEFRCSVILHEMAHMWFGDLVTMRWWDDLWLNESFAEWACYHAAVEATEFDESWTGFTNARKNWALRQDQLPSTHPIAADNHDLQAVEVNFDGITYAKGASVLKQLVAWVGLDNFLVGLRAYFKRHAFGNSEFSDLLSALEEASGRELDSWAKEWLQTSGVNTFTPAFELDESGSYRSFSVLQTAAVENPTLRRHRIAIGLYDLEDNGHGEERLVRRTTVEVDVQGEVTEIAELVGARQPDLLILNDGDLTYAKIRLDERSLATVIGGLSRLDDSLARALCWGAAWDMTRDAELSATDFVTLVLGNIASETDAFGSSRIPGYASQAVNNFAAPANRAELRRTWERGLRRLMDEAEPGSDHQLTFARSYAGSAHTDEALADLEGLLDGTLVLDGLTVDTDLRWSILTGLARRGRADEALIEEELRRDGTISGQEHAAAARACRPTAEAKAEAWEIAVVRDDVPNETQRSVVLSFMQHGQDEVLRPYVEKYLEVAETLWEEKGTQRASTAVEFLFPRPARLTGAARQGQHLAARILGQPRGEALRARGGCGRGALPRRTGEGRRGLSPPAAQPCRVSGCRADSASWPTPCLIPPTRSPPVKADCMPAAARRTASSDSERRTTWPVMISIARAAGSTRIRTLRSGDTRDACSRARRAWSARRRHRRTPRTRSGRRSPPHGWRGRSRPLGRGEAVTSRHWCLRCPWSGTRSARA